MADRAALAVLMLLVASSHAVPNPLIGSVAAAAASAMTRTSRSASPTISVTLFAAVPTRVKAFSTAANGVRL